MGQLGKDQSNGGPLVHCLSRMKTSVVPAEENKVRLHVAVPAEEFEVAIGAAFRAIAGEMRIPGFRPGKAPRRVIEARIGPEVARQQALRDALPDYYQRAVDAEDVDAIAPPTIDITAGEDSGDVEFEALVEVRPIVTIEGYKGLRVTLEDPAVTDDAVTAQVDLFRERFADLEELAAPLATGDYAQIDVKGYVHDEVIEGLSATDFLYEVGSGLVVPKLDDELAGKRSGDILKFNDTLGPQWGERADQEVAFQVLVKAAKRKVLPDPTDEWAKEASEFETIDELRADVRKRIEMSAKIQAQMELREKAMVALADLVTIEAPAPLVERELEHRIHSVLHRLQGQGATITQYLEATGRDERSFIDDMRVGATQAAKSDLALRAVVVQEGMMATDDEVAAEIERSAQQAGIDPKEARKKIGTGKALEAIRSDVTRGKAFQFVVEHAEVVDEAGHPLDIALPEISVPEIEVSVPEISESEPEEAQA